MTLNIQQHPHAHIAVKEGSKNYSYGELNRAVDRVVKFLAPSTTKKLYFIHSANTFSSLVHYLAVLRAGHCGLLLNAAIADEQLESLIKCYQPAAVLRHNGDIQELDSCDYPIADEIALLLSTSGSSGTPKQVALSYANLSANAQSICASLPITARHNTLATLPMYYAYGLSVINSHLYKGATLVFTEYTPVNRGFWELLHEAPVHSMAGVPHSYEMLLRLGLTKQTLPDLVYFTQAGGKLNPRWVKMMHQYCTEHNKAFYVMYGQTEATARMSVLLPLHLAAKTESIGKPVPGGEFQVLDPQDHSVITTPMKIGELHYRGPNVMLGYITGIPDLQGVEPVGWLPTGDLACFDEDGDYYIRGRLKRIIKVHGQRLSLDDVESQLTPFSDNSVVCLGRDDRLVIVSDGQLRCTGKEVAGLLHLHPSTVKIQESATLLFNDNGKLDYSAMQERYCA